MQSEKKMDTCRMWQTRSVLHAICAFLILCTACVVLTALGNDGQSRGEDAAPATDWPLIDFDDNYRLTKVTIEVREKTGDGYERGDIVGRWTFEDKADLERFTAGLVNARIHPPTRTKGAFGVTPVARLECVTNSGTFEVYWNKSFVLNSRSLRADNSFKSMALAAFIDKKLREAGNKGFTDEKIEDLSGMRLLRQDRIKYGRKDE
jgi:hypothetical protein